VGKKDQPEQRRRKKEEKNQLKRVIQRRREMKSKRSEHRGERGVCGRGKVVGRGKGEPSLGTVSARERRGLGDWQTVRA